MCGRFVITSSPEALRRLFGYGEQPNFPARYNIAPTQPVPVVLLERGVRRFMLMRWGFLPAWTKDPKKFGLVINARSETVIDKPAFKNAIRRRRCLIPADGYYEWPDLGARKQPLFVYPAGGGPIAFAALWETWVGPNGEELDTVAIVTTVASADLASFHPRMPVTIAPDAFDLWLDCANVDAKAATSLLTPAPLGTFAWHEVSTAVNRTANDDPRLIERVSAEEAAAEAEAAKPRARASRKITSSDQGSLF
ncbi:SOS response-associated peptidase [Bradyrhizobium sp. LHD-71]|uniref:SOS response-associated peptidase n=1 Tax=Bradyrhizobium sp. LHD-71 TaxID=3072141 RepID=UPI00280F7DBF|nr:SOS response-associated peptidase [Bradyrhizobium sp. LHD-71]MDQ8731471.1 SOS response-associated peptidase [Bradyrhizobium sp. LHD-71]